MANKSFEDMSWFEKMDLVRAISKFPAITVMVFIRRRIGFRLMNPIWLLVMTIIMIVVPAVLAPAAKPFGFLMVVFAFAMLGLGMFQRWKRWHELCHGDHWHTYSAGISYLEYLPLPAYFRAHYRINRFLDPVTVLIAGLLIALFLSHGLGLWIMFSALSLFVFEQDVYEMSLNHDLDILDGMSVSKAQAALVKFFEGQGPQDRQLTVEDTAGVPTGLAPDIHRRVEILRAEQAAAAQKALPTPPLPPDNMVIEAPLR
jgi:hypothetical protein